MADYLTTDTELTSVANAIRTKGGTSASLVYPAGFVSAIGAISTGTDVSDTTATAADVRTGKYFYTSAGVKTQGTIADQAAQTITPTTTDQTIASGKYLTGAQTIKGDANLIAENIAKDVTIFGVTGTYEGGGGGEEDEIITRTISGTYENSRVTTLGGYAFYNCYRLTAVSLPSCTNVGEGAFTNCVSLTTISFPVCQGIGRMAFSGCGSLTAADFPYCTTIGSSAFYACVNLTTISFPACTKISASAFVGCKKLTNAYFPACSDIATSAFSGCTSLTTASFPSCTNIWNNAFYYCSSLATVSFPSCTSIGSYAFGYCSTLSTIGFPSCTSIGSSAFLKCYHLVSLYLTGSSVAKLWNSNAFSSTPIAGYTTSTGGVYGSIYVPSSLLTDYKASTNWTYFSSRFVGLDTTMSFTVDNVTYYMGASSITWSDWGRTAYNADGFQTEYVDRCMKGSDLIRTTIDPYPIGDPVFPDDLIIASHSYYANMYP